MMPVIGLNHRLSELWNQKEGLMLWCLIGVAILLMLLALAAVTVHLPRPHRPHIRVGMLLRGCIATLCLLVAIGLAGLALLVAR